MSIKMIKLKFCSKATFSLAENSSYNNKLNSLCHYIKGSKFYWKFVSHITKLTCMVEIIMIEPICQRYFEVLSHYCLFYRLNQVTHELIGLDKFFLLVPIAVNVSKFQVLWNFPCNHLHVLEPSSDCAINLFILSRDKAKTLETHFKLNPLVVLRARAQLRRAFYQQFIH